MPQTIGQDLVYAGLRIAGIIRGAGRNASPEQLEDGRIGLNRMLSSWSIARSNIYTISIASYPISASSHTIGKDPAGIVTADWDAPRPNAIERALVVLDSLRLPVEVLNDQQWAAIKLRTVVGSFPTKIYNDGGYPFSTIYFWPTPSAACSLELHTWQGFTSIDNLDDAVAYPDGYEEAITYNLAVRMAATFPEANLKPEAAAIARESLARVQSRNAPSPLMSADPAILGSRATAFNVLTGDLV